MMQGCTEPSSTLQPYGRKRNENNERQNHPVKNPRETFSNWQRRRIQNSELRGLRFAVAKALCAVNDIQLEAV